MYTLGGFSSTPNLPALAGSGSVEKKRKEPALKNGKHHRTQERMAVIMIYEKFPEMSGEGDAEKLWCLGTALAKYFFYDMADAVANIYGFSSYKYRKKDLL